MNETMAKKFIHAGEVQVEQATMNMLLVCKIGKVDNLDTS